MSLFAFVETNQYHWLNRIIALIVEIILIVLFLLHGYRMYRWKVTEPKSTKKTVLQSRKIAKYKKLSHIFTILTLFLFAIQGGNYVLNVWSIYGEEASCDVIEIFSVFSYHCCKFSLYIVLILRIKVAFSESVYHQTIQKILYFVYIILMIYVVCTIYGDFNFIFGEQVYTAPNMFYCLLLPLPSSVFCINT